MWSFRHLHSDVLIFGFSLFRLFGEVIPTYIVYLNTYYILREQAYRDTKVEHATRTFEHAPFYFNFLKSVVSYQLNEIFNFYQFLHYKSKHFNKSLHAMITTVA